MNDDKISESELYSEMPWQKLKALMTAEGQAWINAEHAIDFLNKLDKADDSEIPDDENSNDTASKEGADKESATDDNEGADDESDDLGKESDDVITGDDLVTDPEDDQLCLDHDEYYSTIRGFSNAKYFQDGNYFDSQGNHVEKHKGNGPG